MSDPLTDFARRHQLLLLLSITLLGAFLRFYQIDALPPASGYDAAQYGLDALEILDGARPVFLPANFGREALFSYLVAAVYLVTGPGALGVHVSSALIGVATIPAIYLAARSLLEGEDAHLALWAPLLAALVAAVSYWHLNYSRAGLRVIWVPLFAALISAALAHGLQRGSRWSLALGGVLLGLSQYTYQAARLLPLLAAAAFLFAYSSRRSFTRRDLGDVLLTYGLAILVFAPLGLFAWNQPDVFNDRLRQTALLAGDYGLAQQAAAIAEQTGLALRMFFIEGDNEPLYTIPGRPALNPFLALFLLVGIGLALWRWKRPPYLYLLTWLLLLTTPAMIADQAATGKRALGAFPAMAILVALGIVCSCGFLSDRLPQRGRWTAPLLAALVGLGLAWTAVSTYNDYFRRWGQDPALAAHYQRDHTEIGLAAAVVPAEQSVLVSPFPSSHPAILLNSQRHPHLRSYNGHRCLLLPANESAHTYLVVPGETETSIRQLRALYPQGLAGQGPQRPDRDGPYYETFSVPAGVAPAIALRDEPLLSWQGEIALLDVAVDPPATVPGVTVTVTLTYQALVQPSADYTAFIHMQSANGTDSTLASQADAQPCGGAVPTGQWHEGDILIDRISLPVPEEVAPGSFDLTTGFYRWPELAPVPIEDDGSPRVAQLEVR